MVTINIYVIPDTQSKDGVKNPLVPVAHHISEIRPDAIVHLGDHWDFPSLSKYDRGKKSHRVKTYLKDVKAGNKAMEEFFTVLRSQWRNHDSKCKKIILEGNHEFRRNTAIEYGPDELVDLLYEFQPNYSGWHEVVPFLKIKKIKGVNFSHFFQNLNSPKAITTARNLLLKKHESCIAGHQQGFDYAEQLTGKSQIQAMIIGSCYYHEESYKPQSNHHWRGTVLLKDVNNGNFDFDRFSLNKLDKIYG